MVVSQVLTDQRSDNAQQVKPLLGQIEVAIAKVIAHAT
jgi:hypothetical protein